MDNNFISKKFIMLFVVLILILLVYILFEMEISNEEELERILTFRKIRIYR